MDYLRPWSEERRAQFRLPDGRWNGVALAPVITKMRERGLTLARVAEVSGVPYGTIRNSSRHTDHTPDTGVILGSLADTLKVRESVIRQYIHAHGIPFTRFGVKITVSQASADLITDYYQAQLAPADVGPGREWIRIHDLAVMFGTNPDNMRTRLTNAPYSRIRSRKIRNVYGNQHGYNVHDARLILSTRPVALDAPPQDTLSAPAIAQLLGLSHGAVQQYAGRGAPHYRIRQGRNTLLYYRPDALAEWLIARQHPVSRSLGRTLARLTPANAAD